MPQQMIQNPILKGFNPDPNIVKVGDDYFIATSTFEWFPGVQIHHSKDLVHWQLIGQALNRTSQLDMKGVPDSCGVWAPQLNYHQGTFYLIYSNVKSFNGQWKDTPNYLVTTDDIFGEWSEPVFLNASGFDPSLYHDDDGKSYLLNMVMDHRNNLFFGGVVVQEYCKAQQELVGDIHYIFEGTECGRTEAPHILKKDGYYYLITAEGGTSYEHCMTVARSKSLFGPYEVHPDNPFLTAKGVPDNALQKTGHGDIFEGPDGQWYTVFLTGRPLTTLGRCITGRETGIEQVQWRDGWPYTVHGSKAARLQVPAPNLPQHPFEAPQSTVDFSKPLPKDFQSLRVPMEDSWLQLDKSRETLRLIGRESLSSCHEQSLVARRVQAHHTVTETCVDFSPTNYQQMAGLVCYYNTLHFHYLHITGDSFGAKDKRTYLTIVSNDYFDTTEPAGRIDITGASKVYLKADFNGANLQFYYALKQGEWQKIGPVLDGSILSDDYVEHSDIRFHPCFTGAFVGMCCQDLSGQALHADFTYFDYKEFGESHD
ncbi:glycoside hydrolase family 43 protein [Thalassotalea agarivorans]|uniref:Xylan 1,4-beta-xylosidase n=1 Tax=Thalassotalea agarivorans TaxID=349064 RepID=A0A1I0BUS5_THASX|nr:glycoside hydrolase family 43 protein [Thalassotalea agarivorans]SET10149.1 xylan 1,4-beta-xylosidase [Thalassotalea agarivorans]